MSRKYTEIEMSSDEILHRIGRCNVELRQTVVVFWQRYFTRLILYVLLFMCPIVFYNDPL